MPQERKNLGSLLEEKWEEASPLESMGLSHSEHGGDRRLISAQQQRFRQSN